MSAAEQAIAMACDPAFVLDAERGLELSAAARDRVDALEASRWLAMRVARKPLDLRAHAQRIRLLGDCHDAGRLFSALVDLFLVLGDKGRGLREALLEGARPVLDPDDHAYLQAHLGGGLGRSALLPLTIGSVAARGAIGSATMVTTVAEERRAPEPDPYDDPFYVPPDAEQ